MNAQPTAAARSERARAAAGGRGGEGSTGSVHSWDLATGVDGPGTRFTLFTSGCPLRCLYCHNPDTWRMRDGRSMTVDQVVAEIAKYRDFLRAAGGGVTISGGEPLLQPDFTGEILRRCTEMGLHTALDTSGYLGARADDELLSHTNLVLLDIKSFDAGTYRSLTGGKLAPTLSFATRLSRLGIRTWVRYVLVPGWTDDPAAIDGLAQFIAGLDEVERVSVLPFHKLGAPKYEALGIPFPLANTPPPNAETTARVRAQFRAHGLRAD